MTTTPTRYGRTHEEIRTEFVRATEALEELRQDERDFEAQQDWSSVLLTRQMILQATVHLRTYAWLLGDTDIAPWTGRRIPNPTPQDLWQEEVTGRDHSERNVLSYDDPDRIVPEAVYDAIQWARGEYRDPPTG